MSALTYMFDYTGTFQQNLVSGETHTLTEGNFRDFFYIIPKYAPFFTNNLTVILNVDGTSRGLTKDVDYYLALPFYGATRSIGLPVYAAIAFNSDITRGQISISYQTVGGDWVCNPDDVYTALASIAYNPRIVPYEQVTNLPTTFPPINHNQGLTSIVGQDELIAAIEGLTQAITNKAIEYQNIMIPSANVTDFNSAVNALIAADKAASTP